MKKPNLIVMPEVMNLLSQFATEGFIPDSRTHCHRFRFKSESSGRIYTVGLSRKTGGWEINAPYHPSTFKKPKNCFEIIDMIEKLMGT